MEIYKAHFVVFHLFCKLLSWAQTVPQAMAEALKVFHNNSKASSNILQFCNCTSLMGQSGVIIHMSAGELS